MRKDKKVIRPHLVLLIEGRLLLLLLALGPLAMWYGVFAVFRDETQGMDMTVILFGLFVAAITGCCAWVEWYFWHHCWGKLIITQDAVTWKCLFCKTVRIPMSDIRYVDIRAFTQGNVVRNADIYKTGFRYLLISSKPFPKKRIDKIRSGSGLIKFRCNDKICQALYEALPDPYCRRFRVGLKKKQS